MTTRLVERLRAYIVEDFGIRFRNREHEISCILDRFPPGLINIVFGPRGCGKTELARALVHASNDDVYTVYIGYREEETVLRSHLLLPDRELAGFLLSELRQVVEDIGEYFGIPRLVVRGLLTIYDVIGQIRSAVKNKPRKYYIVVVDEFRHGGTSIEVVRQALEVDANIVRDLNAAIKEETGNFSCLKVVYFSSDATAQQLCLKLGPKCRWWLMWYLPKSEFADILSELRCPVDPEVVWRLLGGNLREVKMLIEMEWNIEAWIEAKYSAVLDVIDEYRRGRGVSTTELLASIRRAVDDIDELPAEPLWDYFLSNNIAMYVDARFWKMSELPREPWVGKRCAYQVPVYYWILRTMCEKGRLNITPKDVLSVLSRSE